jgi:hypothetical protein
VTAGYRGAASWPIVWLDIATGWVLREDGSAWDLRRATPVGGVLARIPAGVARMRLLVVGSPPVGWTGWAQTLTTELGPWRPALRGHHVNGGSPALRYRNTITGQAAEFRSAAEWFGEPVTPAGTVYSTRHAQQAWQTLNARLARSFGDGAQLLGSPSVTGRSLAGLTGKLGEQLPGDVRELITATNYQGRIQVFEQDRRRIPGLAHLDARVAYGACTRELGTGPATLDTVRELPLDARGRLMARGRLRVRVTVPPGWDHVGLLARVPGPSPTEYPTAGSFETWADVAECAIALEAGWRLDVLERLLLTQAKPLDLWRDRLERIWRELAADVELDPIVAELARGAIRRLVIFGIGGFAQREQTVIDYYADPADVPPGVAFDEAPDGPGWITRRRVAADPRWAYPELAGQIWARARARLLKAPGGAGALALPGRDVIAFRTDSIYTVADPRWADDGAWGRYRLKGLLTKPIGAPANHEALMKRRDQAATELASLAERITP